MKDQATFFSYAREDSEFALKLAQDLRQGGANVWLDQIDIGAGDRWDISVEGALRDANRMIVVLTPDSISSHNVMDEVSFALEEHMKLIPILLKPCDIPFRLRRLQYIDFTKNYNTGINKILSILVTGKHTASIGEISENSLENEQAFIDEKQNKVEEEAKLKEQAEAKEQKEEDIKLKEHTKATGQKEEDITLKKQTKATRQQEEIRIKEQRAALKNIHSPGKGFDKLTKETSERIGKYKIPLMITVVIAVVVIVIWTVNSGNNYDSPTGEQQLDPVVNETVNSEIQAWNYASKINTIESYKAYQQAYGDGLHFNEAHSSINKIVDGNDWDTAIKADTKDAYQEYLNIHSTGSHVEEANLKITAIAKQLFEEQQRQPQANSEKRKREEAYTKNGVKIAKDKAMNPIGIGKKYLGGIIFYVDNTGQHGLIAAEYDLGKYSWKEAMDKTNNLSLNGFNDWRLPTKDELGMLYRKKDKVSDFVGYNYWSSSESEHPYSGAWSQNFLDGYQLYSGKHNPNLVRAVRSFDTIP